MVIRPDDSAAAFDRALGNTDKAEERRGTIVQGAKRYAHEAFLEHDLEAPADDDALDEMIESDGLVLSKIERALFKATYREELARRIGPRQIWHPPTRSGPSR